jgi:hypothetical protein
MKILGELVRYVFALKEEVRGLFKAYHWSSLRIIYLCIGAPGELGVVSPSYLLYELLE